MKKYFFILLLMFLVVGLTGCDDSQKEINYDDEPIEDRTYDGVVYNKGYFRKASDKSSASESYYAFNEAEKKVIIERTGGTKSSSGKCTVLEGTYEGEFGDKVTMKIKKQNGKVVEEEFENFLYFYDVTDDKSFRYESPTTVVSRVKACFREIQK